MIVLDTHVVSALMRAEPDPVVVAWLDRLPPESLWTTSITVFEIRLGLELLAAGRRKRQLEEAFAKTLEEGVSTGPPAGAGEVVLNADFLVAYDSSMLALRRVGASALREGRMAPREGRLPPRPGASGPREIS